MTLTVKICGIRDAHALDAAIDAGADMAGFVFFERSPRHVALEQARVLVARAAGRIRTVALTVDADDAALAAIVAAMSPDVLQLHGEESPARTAELRSRFSRPVMKAIAVSCADDLAEVADYDAVADALLFDARAPAGTDRPGGNGAVFDWTLLQGLAVRRPWLLAGGLDPETVAPAVRATAAPGVDVSSGVERAPGEKDVEKIRRFVAAARTAR